jgi:hypothetical protein
MTCRFTIAVLLCVHSFVVCSFAAQYQSNAALAKDLKALADKHSTVARLSSVAKSRAGHDVWLLQLGAGDKAEVDKRPALLVIAGIEGNELAGTHSVAAWAQVLAAKYAGNDERTRKLLDRKTIYVFPRVNADAAEAFFQKPQVERTVSTLPVDDDYDGLIDEDGPDDLNGDGLITWMRVEDPEGEYIFDATDSRLLLKADRARGESGKWRYLIEGRDNDNDEAWNEDGPGGVSFNRNFPYNYKFFAPNAGVHQISERETRALADFIVAHPNIAMTFTFGAADNLSQPPKAEAAGANKRPQTDLQPDDLPFFRELGKAWRDALGLKKDLPGASEPGTISDWMYFHRGRLSLAARPWTTALQVELDKAAKPEGKKDEEKKDDAKPKEDQKEEKKEEKKDEKKPDDRNQEERALLKWFDEHAKESFVQWRKIEHPDFPGKNVEVGGFAPFARSNPPQPLLEGLAQKHAVFLTQLAEKFPELRVRQTKVKNLGEGVFDVTVQVENSGYLPTALAQGGVTREVHPTLVELKLDEKTILSGSKRAVLNAIEGSGGMREVRWVIHAPNTTKVGVSVRSTFAGSFDAEIELK